MACITALTVQSSQGVRRLVPVESDVVIETLDCLVEDVCFSSIKVGMLGGHLVAAAVADWLRRHPEIPVVLDPVLKSSSGKDLLDPEGLAILRGEWLGRVNWITPNLPELAALTDVPLLQVIENVEVAARDLREISAKQNNPALRVVVTGGHGKSPDDLLLTREGCRWFPGERVETTSTHGTGCAFSAALAARVALGEDDFSAVQGAKDYVTGALRHAYPVGRGNGPLNHFWCR